MLSYTKIDMLAWFYLKMLYKKLRKKTNLKWQDIYWQMKMKECLMPECKILIKSKALNQMDQVYIRKMSFKFNLMILQRDW